MFGILNKSHRATLDRLLSKARAETMPHMLFADVSDEFWLWAVTEGYRSDPRLKAILPSYPPEDVQLRFAGASGDDTMKDAFAIYQLVKSLSEQHLGRPLEAVLEFGCGWGRILRLFTRHIAPERLWGIDCLPAAMDICTATNPYATFRLVDPFPPTTIADETFDLVYAYSVFSHLSEAAHLAWLREFNRLLKPGGLVVATTRPRDFILACAQARAQGEQRAWAMGTVLSFQNTLDALLRYDCGEYLYEPLGGGDVLDASFFGETCIPERYVRDRWSTMFEFVGFLDDRRLCQQNVAVVRKTGG